MEFTHGTSDRGANAPAVSPVLARAPLDPGRPCPEQLTDSLGRQEMPTKQLKHCKDQNSSPDGDASDSQRRGA